jgi:hypothetical protein
LKADAGTVSAPGVTFSTDLNLGIYRIGADNAGFACNGAKVLDVSATGLGVTGALDVTGALTLGTVLAVAEGGTGAATAADARTALGLVIGTNVQAYDAQLADVAGLAVTDGNFIVGDGANFVAESGATARTSLGLGTMATQAASAVAITGGTVADTTTTNRPTAVATTSGTTADYTSIPSWATRITILLNGVNMGASGDEIAVRVGTSGGVVATGYASGVTWVSSSDGDTTYFKVTGNRGVGDAVYGTVTLQKTNDTVWICQGLTKHPGSGSPNISAGHVDVGGTLDRVRVLGSGVGTFTAGAIQIIYE